MKQRRPSRDPTSNGPRIANPADVQLLYDRHRHLLCALVAQAHAVRETIGYTAGDLKSLRLLLWGRRKTCH